MSSSKTGVERKPRRRNVDGLRLIENESNRQVTFSKRKGGLFRKAGHLSLMSEDVQVAVLVLSTKGRPYSFGSPTVDAVIDRYLNNDDVNVVVDDDDDDVGLPESKFREGMWWWEAAVEGMGEEDLTKYRDFLVKLKTMVQEKMIMMVHQLPSN